VEAGRLEHTSIDTGTKQSHPRKRAEKRGEKSEDGRGQGSEYR